MTRDNLITAIKSAFEHVKLEDGIGIWEAQGIDDYSDLQTIAALKEKDEREYWDKVPYQDLVTCSSSLSFLDAKGMLFYLPKFMIFDLLADEIYEKEQNYAPDILFTLGYKLDEAYQKNRFSLFDRLQKQVIIDFLTYQVEDFAQRHQAYDMSDASYNHMHTNHQYLELTQTLDMWKKKVLE
jgi:hypothetical protein